MLVTQGLLLSASLLSVAAAVPLHQDTPVVVHLESGPHVEGQGSDFQALYGDRTLDRYRKQLGEDGVLGLFSKDVDEGDAFWRDNIKKSNATSPSVVFARVEGIFPKKIINVENFLKWMNGYAVEGFLNRLLQSNPQHYVAHSTGNGTNFIEQAGILPNTYSLVGRGERKSYMKQLPDFPTQIFLTQKLRDGTVIAENQLSFRNKEDGTGIEHETDIYVPSGLSQDQIEAWNQHLSVEASNWMFFIWDDLTSGKWSP